MIFNRRRRARPVLLNERGQGLAVLIGALAGIFWIVGRAKGWL